MVDLVPLNGIVTRSLKTVDPMVSVSNYYLVEPSFSVFLVEPSFSQYILVEPSFSVFLVEPSFS